MPTMLKRGAHTRSLINAALLIVALAFSVAGGMPSASPDTPGVERSHAQTHA
jgi:hypothetical protein